VLSKAEETCYLDASALVKRYVEEPRSETVDTIYRDAYRGVKRSSFSYWDVAEAVVVFDRYERRIGLDSKKLVKEYMTLSRLSRLIVVNVSPQVLRASMKLVLKHHIYVADALQVASAKKINSRVMVTGDKGLADIADAEGLKVLYVGTHS
jgi:predicted nucleic acid-binding protein